jgi:hypothetical protein
LIESLLRELPDSISEYTVLAGGALRCLFTSEYPSDFDLFILSNSPEDLLAKKQELEQHFSKSWRKVFSCPTGQLTTFKSGPYKVQIINVKNQIYKSPQEIIESFDFHVCCMAYHKSTLYFMKEAIENIRSRKLTLNKLTYAAATINRLAKYKKNGYNTTLACQQIVIAISQATRTEIDFTTVYID